MAIRRNFERGFSWAALSIVFVCTHLCRGTCVKSEERAPLPTEPSHPSNCIFFYGMHGSCLLNFPRNGDTLNIRRCLKGYLRLVRIRHVFHSAFCYIYLFCCSLKSALWNCSIYFSQLKMPMYLCNENANMYVYI